MKIIVIGTVKFSLEMLQTICEQPVDLVGVVTGEHNGVNSDYKDLEPFCKQNGISCYKTSDINSKESIEWIRSKGVDLIFCLGWSRLIKSELLNLTSLGIIGYHPTLLPKNRGRHPLIWALVLGLKETGSTFFFMDEGADSGDIISQEKILISAADDANSLYIKIAKIAKIAKMQLIAIVSSILNDNYQRVPQNHNLANSWRKRGQRDGKIDWRMSAKSIHNLVRGLTHPYVGAHFVFAGEEYKVWKSCLDDRKVDPYFEPGKVIKSEQQELVIKCGEGCIKLIMIEPMPNLSTGDYL